MSKVRIWSGEHGAWWRPFGQGYAEKVVNAGLFTPEYAASIARSAGPEKKIEVRPAPGPVDPEDDLRTRLSKAIDSFPGKLHSEKIDAVLTAFRL